MPIKSPTIVNVRMVRNLAEPDKPWRVAWQSPAMCAPSFWYYETKAEADGVADRLGRTGPDVAPFADLPESPARDRALDRWRRG